MTKTSSKDLLDSVSSRLGRVDFLRVNGRVVQVVGLVLESEGPDVQVGDLCEVRFRRRNTALRAEVVGFRGDRVLLMPLGDIQDIGPGCDVVAMGRTLGVHVGPALLGRVIRAGVVSHLIAGCASDPARIRLIRSAHALEASQ